MPRFANRSSRQKVSAPRPAPHHRPSWARLREVEMAGGPTPLAVFFVFFSAGNMVVGTSQTFCTNTHGWLGFRVIPKFGYQEQAR